MKRNLFEYHPILGYRFIPRIKARVSHESGGYLVKCNQAGFRCEHEVTKEKTKNTFRIILFGDSYTAGDGVSNKYRFGDVLESRFPHMEVLNFGLPGSGTDQHYLAFKEFAKDIEYDLLLICPLTENIRRNMVWYRLSKSIEKREIVAMPKPYFALTNNKLVLHNSPVPKEVLRERDLQKHPELKKYVDEGGRFSRVEKFLSKYAPFLKDPIQKFTRYQPMQEYNKPNSPAWLLMKAILAKWVKESEATVLICPIPVYQYIEKLSSSKSFRKRFSELGEELGVEVADILPRFWEETKQRRRECRFEKDQHPTPLGHKIIAEGMAPYIEKYYNKWRETA
ncbi:SGNH/GDSL hydrolase family protein [candidate division WOR-3 bacterium]|nr:SGNH/GDSL hydrolase family protein [candidate division WOR-3 bacterium]